MLTAGADWCCCVRSCLVRFDCSIGIAVACCCCCCCAGGRLYAMPWCLSSSSSCSCSCRPLLAGMCCTGCGGLTSSDMRLMSRCSSLRAATASASAAVVRVRHNFCCCCLAGAMAVAPPGAVRAAAVAGAAAYVAAAVLAALAAAQGGWSPEQLGAGLGRWRLRCWMDAGAGALCSMQLVGCGSAVAASGAFSVMAGRVNCRMHCACCGTVVAPAYCTCCAVAALFDCWVAAPAACSCWWAVAAAGCSSSWGHLCGTSCLSLAAE